MEQKKKKRVRPACFTSLESSNLQRESNSLPEEEGGGDIQAFAHLVYAAFLLNVIIFPAAPINAKLKTRIQ